MMLSLISMTVSIHYSTVMENSKSITYFFNNLRKDHDNKTKSIHILNVVYLKTDRQTLQLGLLKGLMLGLVLVLMLVITL